MLGGLEEFDVLLMNMVVVICCVLLLFIIMLLGVVVGRYLFGKICFIWLVGL